MHPRFLSKIKISNRGGRFYLGKKGNENPCKPFLPLSLFQIRVQQKDQGPKSLQLVRNRSRAFINTSSTVSCILIFGAGLKLIFSVSLSLLFLSTCPRTALSSPCPLDVSRVICLQLDSGF